MHHFMTAAATEALKARWTNTSDANAKAIFDGAAGVVERMAASRKQIDGNANLSDAGKASQLKDFAGKQRAIFAHVRSNVAGFEKQLKTDRDALVPRQIDKTDAAGAALRGEFRAFMRTMTPLQLMGWIASQNDPAIITAMWETLPALSGLDDKSRDELTEQWVATNRGAQLSAIEERTEVVELVKQAVNLAQSSLHTAAGARTEAEFEAWLTPAA